MVLIDRRGRNIRVSDDVPSRALTRARAIPMYFVHTYSVSNQ